MNRQPDVDVAVRFWGARGSIPAPAPDTALFGANTSCVEIRVGDQILILDAGSGIRRLGASLLAEFGTSGFEATLLISHTHWDHIQGLPFFAPAYSSANRIQIFAPPGKGAQVQDALIHQMKPVNFPVPFENLCAAEPVKQLAEGGEEIGKVSVRSMNLHHPGGCGAYRLDVAGISIAYLSDHEPYHSLTFGSPPPAAATASQSGLAAFVRECDLLLLDTQYDESEYPNRIGWGHGCVPDSVALAFEAGARELVFVHHDPSHSDAKITEMVSRAEDMISNARSPLVVRAAREGEESRLCAKRAGSSKGPIAAADLPPRRANARAR